MHPESAALPCQRLANRSLLRVANQDDVGFSVAAYDGELLAVIRVVEIADEFRLEVDKLLSRRTIKVPQPEIIGLAVANGVNDASAVALEHDRPIAHGTRTVPTTWSAKRKQL